VLLASLTVPQLGRFEPFGTRSLGGEIRSNASSPCLSFGRTPKGPRVRRVLGDARSPTPNTTPGIEKAFPTRRFKGLGRLRRLSESQVPRGSFVVFQRQRGTRSRLRPAATSVGCHCNTTLSQVWVTDKIRNPQCAFEMSMFMCPAVHMSARILQRPSSTHEPSDPPFRVVSCDFRHSKTSYRATES